MKQQLLYIIIAVLFFVSCKKGLTDYQMRILLRNSTDSTITVQVFPKYKYAQAGKYSYSDTHKKYKDTTFVPDKKLGTELYSTDTLDMDPDRLISRVFDSIHVRLKSGKVLSFSPQKAMNYSVNPFADRSAWIYQRNDLEYIRTWRENDLVTNDYIFVIEGLR